MKILRISACLLWISLMAWESASARERISFLPMWLPQPQFAGYYMAREKGIYDAAGLDVTILDQDHKSNVADALSQGTADFGIMNLLAAIEKKAQGMDLVNVGQVFQKSAIEFVARRDSGIQSVRDFNGRKIAVWRTVLQAQTLGFIHQQKIRAEIYPVDEGINFFQKRAVDIISVMHYNEYDTLINHGIDPQELILFRLGDFNMDFPEDGIYCLAQSLRADPGLARRFVEASMAGWDYALTHPGETIALIQKIRLKRNLVTNPPHQEWMMAAMPDLIRPKDGKTPAGHLARSDYDHAVDFLLQTRRISQKVSYDDFYCNR